MNIATLNTYFQSQAIMLQLKPAQLLNNPNVEIRPYVEPPTIASTFAHLNNADAPLKNAFSVTLHDLAEKVKVALNAYIAWHNSPQEKPSFEVAFNIATKAFSAANKQYMEIYEAAFGEEQPL